MEPWFGTKNDTANLLTTTQLTQSGITLTVSGHFKHKEWLIGLVQIPMNIFSVVCYETTTVGSQWNQELV